MKRKLVSALLASSVLGTGAMVAAPGAMADRCGRVVYARRGYGERCYRPRYYSPVRIFGGGCRRRDDDHDGGPSIGTLLLGAAAGYGAYRLYEDARDHNSHHSDGGHHDDGKGD